MRVRRAARDEVGELVGVLSRAFFDDPVAGSVMPDPQVRRLAQPVTFEGILKHFFLPKGIVEAALDDERRIRAVAIWSEPGQWKIPAWREVVTLPALARAIGFGELGKLGKRTRSLYGLINKAHPATPHWYLAVLATDPDAQRQGFGRALLTPRLQRCDRDQVAAYLECCDANVAYYEKFGFRVTGEIVVPSGGPVLFTMLRDPQK